MSKFLARLGGGGKKKDSHSPSSSPSGPIAVRPGTPSSPASDRRKSKQLLNFGLSSPENVPERSTPGRDASPTTSRSAAPRIELDFGEGTSHSSAHESALQSTGVGLQSPITGDFSAQSRTESRLDDKQQRRVISGAEAELLRHIEFTWTQVERAWDVAGQELKVIGLKTPELFHAPIDKSPESSSLDGIQDEANRLLAIFTISTSSSPSSVITSFPSLSDYYPPVSFIPQSQEWHDNDFKTNIGWTKNPHVLVRFLKMVTQQVKTEHSHPGATSDTSLPGWYQRFEILERKSSYPSDAFSRLLSPLITPEHYRALWTIFDRWAVISANAAHNGCRAREVLCGMLGWWLMDARFEGSGSRNGLPQEGCAEGWRSLHSAWEKARDATYHLFMAWIRDQEETGTLPLLVLDHVKDYQTRLEEHLQNGANDEMTVLECKLLYQPSSTTASSTYMPSAEDLLGGALKAFEDATLGERSDTSLLRNWQRGTEDGVDEDVGPIGVLNVVRAIRDARYPHILTTHERNSSTALPKTPTATSESFYRPFRTPSSSSFMNDGGTPNSTSSPGFNFASAANQASPSQTPYTPVSSTTTPIADAPNSTTLSENSENWTDFAQTGFGEAVAKPKPFVLGEAFKQLKLRDGQPNPQASEPRDLVMGRSVAHRRAERSQYPGTYSLESCDTATLSVAFIGFQHEARNGREHTRSWPAFGIFDVIAETARKYSLCANRLLVSVRVQLEIKKEVSPGAAAPPSSIPRPLENSPTPLQQPVSHPPSAPDAEKRNRRRSFFRSFSGSSAKNRRTSSVNISSPLESPLPAVAEKREPRFPSAAAIRAPSPLASPQPAQTPQVSKLVSGNSPQTESLRSRSPSSMHRKPVPALDETELRELGLAGAGEVENSSRASVPQSSQAPSGASSRSLKTSFPSATVVDLTEPEELVTAESSVTSVSLTEEHDITKSPARKRRSGAPSPASSGPADIETVGTQTSGVNGDVNPEPVRSAEHVNEPPREATDSSALESTLESSISPLEKQTPSAPVSLGTLL